ncbi:hypothetical protein C8D92_101296 [Tamilnaduibacter salinus]|nr:glycosyltransferase [Tamilnaduibacter salinus]PVY79090.1 hypothetical protein C8D92_101296 [Tamilnaduibacter salinus]
MGVVLVVGMHRSGTSAICRLLDNAGVDFGTNLIPPGDDNPLGFWEDRDFIGMNEELLGSVDAWQRVVLPTLGSSEQWQRKAKTFLARWLDNRSSGAAAVGLKDPRVSRTLEQWLPFLKRPQVLFVVRNPLSVAHSLNRRDGMSVEYGLALWFVYNFEAFKALQDHCVAFQVVNYDLLMGGDTDQKEQIQNFLGLTDLNMSLLERKLQHQRFDTSDVHEDNFIEELSARFWEVLTSDSPDYGSFETAYKSVMAFYKPFSDLADRLNEAQEYSSHVEADNQLLREQVRKFELEADESKRYATHLEADIESLHASIDHLEGDLDGLRQTIASEQRQNRSMGKTINDLQNNLLRQEELLEQKESEMADTVAKYQSLQTDYQQLEQVRWQVDVLLQQLYSSKSWRWTAPLRYFRKVLSVGIRKTVLPVRWMASYFLRRLSSVKARALVSSRQNATALQHLVDNRSLEKFWNPFPDAMPPELPKIGLSVVLYNNGRWLQTFMESLLSQDYPLDKIHLFFVDNSSTDDTHSKLKDLLASNAQRFASLQVARRPNAGFGSGHDYAIRKLNVDYVLVSNVDLEFQREAIVNAVSAALSDKDVASWELRQSPYEHPKYVDPVTLQVNWSSHACILIERKVYLEVGGYEPRIFMYGEDVELSYRFRRAGYQLKYLPRAVVFHHTYESEGEIKPLQFSGSTAANLLIRCRYGNISDVLVGYFLIFALAFRGAGFNDSRRLLWRSLPGTLAKSMFFLATREKSKAAFPFRGFDYDLCREGAFWESDRAIIDQLEDLPLVTVITRTVEGREALLNQAIFSVMNQTYPSIQHIITEDGGDSTKALCEQVGGVSPERYEIRHLRCPKKGRAHAANRALDEAAGQYVVILDDDDLLLPDHIEALVTEILRNDSDAAYSLAWDTPVKYFDKSRGYYTEHAHITLPLFYQEFDREVLFHHNFLPIQSVLFKRSLAGQTIRFDEDLDYLEDWVFWKRLTKGADFRFVKKTTSIYKTPLSVNENFARRRLLDEAYKIASERPIS